jgi:hypothetical protein
LLSRNSSIRDKRLGSFDDEAVKARKKKSDKSALIAEREALKAEI